MSTFLLEIMFFLLLGIKFWKVGSRKIYAVKEKGKGKKRKRWDSDDDEFIVKGKGKKCKKNSSSEEDEEETVLMKKIISIDRKVSKVLDVNPHLTLSLGLSTILMTLSSAVFV